MCPFYNACLLLITNFFASQLALLLMQRGADVNAQTKSGWIPMHFSVNTGILELVELLHSHGGRADIVNEWMKTPLDIAKERKNDEMLEILKKRPGTAPAIYAQEPEVQTIVIEAPKALNNAPKHPLESPRSKTTPNLGKFTNRVTVPMPSKSPRRAESIVAPKEEAPQPPTSKPLPQTPADDSLKTRSIRNNPEIIRLSKEVVGLKSDVEFLKNELAKVLERLDRSQTDL